MFNINFSRKTHLLDKRNPWLSLSREWWQTVTKPTLFPSIIKFSPTCTCKLKIWCRKIDKLQLGLKLGWIKSLNLFKKEMHWMVTQMNMKKKNAKSSYFSLKSSNKTRKWSVRVKSSNLFLTHNVQGNPENIRTCFSTKKQAYMQSLISSQI